MQGTDDPIVPVSQARLFRNALEEAGDKVHMYLVPGGHHSMGGKVFDDILCEFLDFYLKGTVTVTEPKVLAEHYRNVDLLDGEACSGIINSLIDSIKGCDYNKT